MMTIGARQHGGPLDVLPSAVVGSWSTGCSSVAIANVASAELWIVAFRSVVSIQEVR